MMNAGVKTYQQVAGAELQGATQTDRGQFILRYAPLVKRIVERMAMRLPPNISKRELTSAGIMGLFDAFEKFNPERGIKFKTYASLRIKGAMLDELRRMDWVSNSVRRDIHKIEKTIRALELKFGRSPDDDEIAQDLGVDRDIYYRMIGRAQGAGLLSLDSLMAEGVAVRQGSQAPDGASPFDELKKKELRVVIAEALDKLSDREQLIMSLYYYEDMTLREIAEVLDLTESRISQIHSKVILKLRTRLRVYYEG